MPRRESAFLLLAITFGLALIALIPPFHAPDEWNHFFRAYQVSEGRIIAEKDPNGRVGGYLPRSLVITAASVYFNIPYSAGNMPRLYEAISDGATTEEDLYPFTPEKKAMRASLTQSLFHVPLEQNRRVFISFANTGRFAPVGYLPQALGIRAGRLLDVSPVALMYMARLFNLALWVLLTWMAIRIMPAGGTTLYLLALMPSALYQASSASADPMATGAAFLLVAAIMARASAPDEGNRGLWLITMASLVVAVTKFYIFLPAMYGAVAFGRPDRRRTHILTAGLLVAASTVAAGLWLYICKDMITPLRLGIDPGAQLSFIMNDPARFLSILTGTFGASGLMYAGEFVGQMGHVQVPVPEALTLALWAALIFSALPGERRGISGAAKALAVAVTIASAGTFIMLSYLTWTPVAEGVIQGIQGRYFIPLGPVAFLMLLRQRVGGHANGWLTTLLTAWPAAALGTMLWLLIKAYY